MGEKFDALDDRQQEAVRAMVGDTYMHDAFRKEGFHAAGMTEAQKEAHLQEYMEAGQEQVAGDPALVAKALRGLEFVEESEVVLQQVPPAPRRGGGSSHGRGR